MLLDDQLAVVTGAGGSIGRATATALAHHGARIAAVDVDRAGLHTTAEKIGEQAAVWELDVGSRESCERLARDLAGRGDQASVVVNCAGLIRRGVVDDEAAIDDWDLTIRVDLSASFIMVRTLIPHLAATNGCVVNVGSIQSFMHGRNSVAYTTAKHGVLGLTRALASELGPRGIRVNGVAPGLVETELNRSDLAAHPERKAAFVARSPLGTLVSPDTVADAVVFLASPLARGVTGAMLPVDSGYLVE